MELVKTYDNVGNLSEETYIEDFQGQLTKTDLLVGKEKDSRPELRRIYFDLKTSEDNG